MPSCCLVAYRDGKEVRRSFPHGNGVSDAQLTEYLVKHGYISAAQAAAKSALGMAAVPVAESVEVPVAEAAVSA